MPPVFFNMMTQIEFARKGIITPVMKQVAVAEQLDESYLCRSIASGCAVILRHRKRT
jgi:thiamine biosynthesis protein ThiC